jgi:hypothetical protein
VVGATAWAAAGQCLVDVVAGVASGGGGRTLSLSLMFPSETLKFEGTKPLW